MVTFDFLLTEQFTSAREKFSRVKQSASNALKSRGSKKTGATWRRGRWDIRVQFPKQWWRIGSVISGSRDRTQWWWHSILGTWGWFFPRKSFPLRKKSSLQQQNWVQLIVLYLLCYGAMWLPPPFVALCMAFPRSRTFSGWRLCVYLQPPLKNMLRRPWGGTSFVQIFENFENLTISSFWWKEINLRPTVSKDFNGLLLVEEFFSHRKALSGLVNPLGLRTDL